MHGIGGAIVLISVNRENKCNSKDLDIGRIKEETDTRIILHMKH